MHPDNTLNLTKQSRVEPGLHALAVHKQETATDTHGRPYPTLRVLPLGAFPVERGSQHQNVQEDEEGDAGREHRGLHHPKADAAPEPGGHLLNLEKGGGGNTIVGRAWGIDGASLARQAAFKRVIAVALEVGCACAPSTLGLACVSEAAAAC